MRGIYKKLKLVHGVGINDADYVTQVFETISHIDGKRKRKLIWRCPYYTTWKDMLGRCYSKTRLSRFPAYRGCYVCEEWLTFSEFKAWMESQNWEGKQLDKDILFSGNKVYSSDTCIFVDQRVNKFLTERTSLRGQYYIGVSYMSKPKNMQNELSKPYKASVNTGYGQKTLGLFSTPEEAHEAWLAAKLQLARELAAEIVVDGGDPRIGLALVDRYEKYEKEIICE